MVSVGLLVRDGEVIANAPATQTYLTAGAPAYFGDYYRLQIGKQIYRDMAHLHAGLTGNRSDLAHREMSGWLSDPNEAEEFSRAQHAGSMGPALMLANRLDLSGARSLLDVAGGTGAYSIAFCRQNQDLLAVILDFPTVIDVARDYVDAAGMADGIDLLPGDARETVWPSGQDVVFMSYLLSAVAGGDLPMLLDRAFAALRPGGRLILHDFMLDQTRSGPRSAALFFLFYLVNQPDAVSFTVNELSPLIAEAGFSDLCHQVMIPDITMMVQATKPVTG